MHQFHPEPAPLSLDTQVRVDLSNTIQENSIGLVGANLLSVIVVVAMLWGHANNTALMIWAGLQGLIVAAGLRTVWHTRGRPSNAGNANRRLLATTRGATITGLLWCAGALILWPQDRMDLQLFLILIMTGQVAGALNSLNAHLPAYYGFMVPCTMGVVAACLRQGGVLHVVIAWTSTVFGVTCWKFGASLHRTLVDSVRRRHEMAALAQQLQAEKERAEEANLSKSRFLAAASHDLRQPLHALNLFAGSLQRRPLDAEAQTTVGHIAATLGAMGGMFNALLDVSRLQAGTVQPNVCVFDLKPVLRRVCGDEGAVAQAKGLTLRLDSPTLPVLTDPMLLERVIRNLVSNAVRYTDHGGVTVSARLRGHRALVRVADSGVGISATDQRRVFDEFVQLHNPERDASRGLGLGLAIVRQLAQLLQLPLTLRSRSRRGSVFGLRIPTAQTDVVQALADAPTTQVWQAHMGGQLALVVDDNAAVRTATADLLQGWGLQVLVAGSLDDLRPQLGQLTAPPALLVCDYRLRDGQNGLDVVEFLNNEYNQAVPAILVTGDTGPDRLREAAASGANLLHKPVPPDLLRSEIARLLGLNR